MLSEIEYLLVCLGEECAEVQQAASKVMRFGLTDSYKDYGENRARLQDEVIDVLAVLEMVFERKIITLPDNLEEKIKAKQAKVLKYMDYSRDRKVLE
jgi:mannose-6-phosphate isomerase class I